MGEWIEKSLGEITSYISKGIPPKYTDTKDIHTVYVLNQKCNRKFSVTYENARLHNSLQKAVPQDKYLKYGDVLINSTGEGTAGRIAQIYNVQEPTTVDGHMIILRPTDDIDILYFGYAIKQQHKKIESLAEGSTGQTEINRQRLLSEITIRFPREKHTQKRIAKLFYEIDEKIQINTEINNNLVA